jgi:hypothetical protein
MARPEHLTQLEGRARALLGAEVDFRVALLPRIDVEPNGKFRVSRSLVTFPLRRGGLGLALTGSQDTWGPALAVLNEATVARRILVASGVSDSGKRIQRPRAGARTGDLARR